MITLIILVVLVITVYLFLSWNHNYWAKHNVPFAEPHLLFGSIKEIMSGSKHFGVFYMDLYKKFKNYPYFGYYKVREPSLIIRDPELIKNIIIKDYASFSANDFQVDPDADPIWAENLFSQNGDGWKKNRSAWTAALTASKLKAMYEQLNLKCNNMITFVSQHVESNPNEPLETRNLTLNFFLDAILSCIVGVDVNSYKMKVNPYKNITQSLFKSTFWDGAVTMSFMFLPKLANFFKMRFVPKRIEKDLLKITKDILKNRQATGLNKTNAMDTILTHGENATKGVSDVAVAGTLFSFLLDGTETSSGVMAYMLYALALDLNIQSKMRAEIDEAFEADDGNLTYDRIQSLQYLDMVVSETMRKYPPALSIQRLCTKPYSLPPIKNGDKPVNIPVGMPVIIPTYALHMDPEYYPEPEKFDPERFSEENKRNIPKCAYLPFGEGPRICIGFRLALNQTKVGIVNLLRNFEVRLAPNMKDKELIIDPNIFIMKPIGDLWVTFHKRSDK